mmetsp:Transcript_23039/g.50676  ORF Transcript_23039/g.50676 Transcript_23039/m.50676 type:complete len:206 (+) Transcript_23039:1324-1941(+)
MGTSTSATRDGRPSSRTESMMLMRWRRLESRIMTSPPWMCISRKIAERLGARKRAAFSALWVGVVLPAATDVATATVAAGDRTIAVVCSAGTAAMAVAALAVRPTGASTGASTGALAAPATGSGVVPLDLAVGGPTATTMKRTCRRICRRAAAAGARLCPVARGASLEALEVLGGGSQLARTATAPRPGDPEAAVASPTRGGFGF